MAKRELPGWWQAEVDWLVNCSEGEHGRRAVPLEPSLGCMPDQMEDMRVEAVQRARRVNRALETLPAALRGLLLAAHEHVSPRRCKDAHAAHARLCERVSDLMLASAAFKRAWLALGPVRRAA